MYRIKQTFPVVLTLVLLTACATTVFAQPDQEKTAFPSKAVQRGVQLKNEGKWSAALATLQDEQNSILVAKEKSPDAAHRLLELGRQQMNLTTVREVDAEVRQKAIRGAIQSFENVKQLEDPHNRAMAQVLLAGAYMQVNDAGKALEQLKSCDRTQFDPQQLTAIDYNIGRALQEQGKNAEAERVFRNVLKSSTGFVPAADRLIEVTIARSQESDDERRKRISSLADEFLSRGNPNQAIKLARQVIQRYEGNWENLIVRDAVGTLCSAWATEYRGPDDQQSAESIAWLQSIRCPGQLIEDYARVVQGDAVEVQFSILEDSYQSNLQFSWMSQKSVHLTQGWSRVITAVADWYAAAEFNPETRIRNQKRRDARKALFLYMLAWGMDRQNTRASVGVLNLFTPEQDPEFFREYFDGVFDAIFHAKSDMYVAKPETLSDWETLVHFHTVLGKLMELRGDEPGNLNDPRSPLGQWTLAIKAEDRVRNGRKDAFIGSVELYERLSWCYERQQAFEKAFDARLTAAERAVALQDVIKAQEILGLVPTGKLNDAQKVRRNQIDRSLTALRNQ
ncbi:MAG: hypothetical protein KDA96_00430 [Planctomycetaceae bacterium]|nr:hypothetical protein [Planctomycetaceae bacterium]